MALLSSYRAGQAASLAAGGAPTPYSIALCPGRNRRSTDGSNFCQGRRLEPIRRHRRSSRNHARASSSRGQPARSRWSACRTTGPCSSSPAAPGIAPMRSDDSRSDSRCGAAHACRSSIRSRTPDEFAYLRRAERTRRQKAGLQLDAHARQGTPTTGPTPAAAPRPAHLAELRVSRRRRAFRLRSAGRWSPSCLPSSLSLGRHPRPRRHRELVARDFQPEAGSDLQPRLPTAADAGARASRGAAARSASVCDGHRCPTA